jgi:hypothetical protein
MPLHHHPIRHRIISVRHRHNFPSEAVERLSNLHNSSVQFAASWPTLPSHLENLARVAPPGSFLHQRLRDVKPGRCVTFYMAQQIWGSNLVPIQNIVTVCPRTRRLDDVIEEMKPMLESLSQCKDRNGKRFDATQRNVVDTMDELFVVRSTRRMNTPHRRKLRKGGGRSSRPSF